MPSRRVSGLLQRLRDAWSGTSRRRRSPAVARPSARADLGIPQRIGRFPCAKRQHCRRSQATIVLTCPYMEHVCNVIGNALPCDFAAAVSRALLRHAGRCEAMSEERKLTFSQREGYEAVPRPLQLGELPAVARTDLWNVLYADIYSSGDLRGKFIVIEGVWETILRDVHVQCHHRPLDEWTGGFQSVCAGLRKFIEQEPFNKIFDLFQYIMRHDRCPEDFVVKRCRWRLGLVNWPIRLTPASGHDLSGHYARRGC